jgi:hypothetical protein
MENKTKLTDEQPLAYKHLLCEVLNTWDNCKVVYKGNVTECEKYINGNNVYQSNYSKLVLRRL